MKIRRGLCAAHNVLKPHGLQSWSAFGTSNIILALVVFEPGIANRKSMCGEAAIRGFLWIRVLDWRDRLPEYAFEFGESKKFPWV